MSRILAKESDDCYFNMIGEIWDETVHMPTFIFFEGNTIDWGSQINDMIGDPLEELFSPWAG
jgi:hypothetical protein